MSFGKQYEGFGSFAEAVTVDPGPRLPKLDDAEGARALWARALRAMGPEVVAETSLEIWIRPLVALGFNRGELYLGARRSDASWVRRRFERFLGQLVHKLDDQVQGVEVVVWE